jgi:glycosyltransferase involved in cell wall biosynthesis
MSENCKKIVFVTSGLSVGGAEVFLIYLLKHMQLVGYEKILINLGHSETLQKEIPPEIRYINNLRSGRTDILSFVRVRRFIHDEKPEKIFCLNFFSFIFLHFALLGSKTRTHRIISYHSTIHLDKKKHLQHKLASHLLRPNDLVITVCNNQLKYTSSTYGIPESQFKTIYNGIDPERWPLLNDKQKRSDTRKLYGIPDQAPVIIMVAGLRPEKNHTGAIRALKILHEEYQVKAYLLLAGSGPEEANIREKVKSYGLEQFVVFAGLQNDVKLLLWASDIFTLSSLSETFSIACLEAMSCGLPCVLTDVGGASEMIDNGKNGFLCSFVEKDIAEKWNTCLQARFSADMLHNLVQDRFNASSMIMEYEIILSK